MNECVLVVDDDREIVRAIALLLEKEGYRCLLYTSTAVFHHDIPDCPYIPFHTCNAGLKF